MFSHNFPVLSKFTVPIFWVLGTVWISASPKICKKHLTLECFVFSYFSHSFFTFPMFGDNTTDVKTNENFYFWSQFNANVYVKLFTREIILFCSWSRLNISIFDPFVIEVWKNIQCRRAGSVCYSSVSIGIGIQSECQSEFF